MNDDPSFQADASGDDPERDIRLMEKVRAGDMDAFRELVEAHQHRVIGTVTRMLGDANEAEDLSQQIFVRVWKSAPRWEPTAKFTTWTSKSPSNKAHGSRSANSPNSTPTP